MKKTVAAALAAAFVVGTASTTFAADDSWRMEENPFRDVDKGHWSYRAVEDLRLAGIVNGYGDGYFLGEKTITRYEMAQIVAKALANFDKFRGDVNSTSARNSRATLDQLREEFRPELERLGVLESKVSQLEKFDDKVIWQGKIEYTYKSARTDNAYDSGHTKVNQDDWIFRFEPIVVVNGVEDPNGKVTLDNANKVRDEDGNLVPTKSTTYKSLWTLRARIDAHADLSRDQSSDFSLERGWAQGDYNNFQIKVGRQPLYTNEDGIVWDTEYTGGEITFGKLADGLRLTAYGGRLGASKVVGSTRNAGSWNGRRDDHHASRWNPATGRVGRDGDDPSSFWALNLQYDPGSKGLFGGAGYYNIKDDDLRNYVDENGTMHRTYSNDGDSNKAKIWSVNAGYRLGKAQLWGAFAKNTEADVENNSWQALLKYGDLYGGGNQSTHKGQWAVWAGYKKLGSNSSLQAINWDDAYAGTKGVVAGASWAPMDRIVFIAKYFKGKYIEGNGDAERLFGRVEFFF